MTKKPKLEKTKASTLGPASHRYRISVAAPESVTQERIDEHVAILAAHWVPKYSPPSKVARRRMTSNMLAKYSEAGDLVAELAAELGYKKGLVRIREIAPWASIPPLEGKTIPMLESELFKYRYARKQLMAGYDVDFVDPEGLGYKPPIPDTRLGTDEDLEDLIFWAQEGKSSTEELDLYWREAKARNWPKQKMNALFGGEDE